MNIGFGPIGGRGENGLGGPVEDIVMGLCCDEAAEPLGNFDRFDTGGGKAERICLQFGGVLEVGEGVAEVGQWCDDGAAAAGSNKSVVGEEEAVVEAGLIDKTDATAENQVLEAGGL